MYIYFIYIYKTYRKHQIIFHDWNNIIQNGILSDKN